MKITHILFVSTNLRILLLLFAFFTQVSCGFRPAYKVDVHNENFLSFVEINPIRTIEGTNFYNHLKSIFPPAKESLYVLNTALSFNRSYNVIQSNSDILRETQNIKVTYQLIDKKDLKVLTYGTFSKMSSYSTNFSLYSNSVIRQDSMSDLAENAAEEVRNRLLMFFSKNH
ncbi:MAG: hypothetical protein KGO98_05060 [Rickettsiales bacterium]|jgi:hypothetical protein|nr:hypothetical protein [Rickettsiales bacterium]